MMYSPGWWVVHNDVEEGSLEGGQVGRILNCRYGMLDQELLLRANCFGRGGIIPGLGYGQVADNDRKIVNDTVQENKFAFGSDSR
jgi:hypothetical protein